MGRKKGLPYRGCQLVNSIKEMMELENQLFYNQQVIVSGKNHHWMLNPVGKSLMRNRIFTWLQSVLPEDTYRKKIILQRRNSPLTTCSELTSLVTGHIDTTYLPIPCADDISSLQYFCQKWIT